MNLRLVPGSGPSIEITRDNVVVGRDPTCEVVVNDPSISRRHARLERRADGWTVVDEGSSNGTFVNSRRVSTASVGHGQELRFGTAGFRVEITTPAPDASRPSATIFEQPLPSAPRRMGAPSNGSTRPTRPVRVAAPWRPEGEAPPAAPEPARPGIPRWLTAGVVVALVAGATVAVLTLTAGGDKPATSLAAAAAPASLPAGSFEVRTLGVDRARDGSQVTLRLEIRRFASRPEGQGHRIDLAVDLATFAPDGGPVPDLTRREFRRLSQVLGAEERTASLTTTLALPAGSRPGAHRARFTVRDLVAGTEVVHEVPFEHR